MAARVLHMRWFIRLFGRGRGHIGLDGQVGLAWGGRMGGHGGWKSGWRRDGRRYGVPGAGVGMRTEMLCFLQLRDRS